MKGELTIPFQSEEISSTVSEVLQLTNEDSVFYESAPSGSLQITIKGSSAKQTRTILNSLFEELILCCETIITAQDLSKKD